MASESPTVQFNASGPTLKKASAKSTASHLFTFPPFPGLPPGTSISSFEEFKEGGIRIDPGPNDEEIDSYGVPTIQLRNRHTNDMCKTNSKRKREAEQAKARKRGDRPARKKEWWEVWDHSESTKYCVRFDRSVLSCFLILSCIEMSSFLETGPRKSVYERLLSISQKTTFGHKQHLRRQARGICGTRY